MTKAVAYFRTSSATNVGADKDSEKRQRESVTSFARRGGYEIVDEFNDAAVSGADAIDERPGFAAMLKRIAGNGVRVILVETANRFARDLIVQETGWRFLQGLGVTLIAVEGGARAQEARDGQVRRPPERRRGQSGDSCAGEETGALSGQRPQALAAGGCGGA
jgi:DNA invertase Pin-like site-specific DNA recombinase